FCTASVIAIQNGSAVKDSTLYPYFVDIGNPHVCGGAFLSLEPEAWVLTAAHCVADGKLPIPSPNPYYVSYGDVSRSNQKIAAIADWKVHPKYQRSNDDDDPDMHYDVALVKLTHPVKKSTTVSRIAIAKTSETVDENSIASVMGVGYTGYNLPQSPELLHMLVNISKYNPGSSDMIETNPSDNTGVCHGDSGGPLVKRSPWTGQPFLFGVLSRIFNAYDPDPTNATCPKAYNSDSTPSTDGYVNIPNLLPWIAETTSLSIDQLTSVPEAPSLTEQARMENVVANTASRHDSISMFIASICISVISLFYHNV
ncbi:hypothetical protein INT43_002297, partial [Umbelopsis isabellina]